MSEESAVDLTDIEVNDEQVDQFFNGEDIGLPDAEQDEPVAESQPEPEAEAEPKPEIEEKEKFVPHGALHEERMRRKEMQQQLEEIRQRNEKMEQTFQKLMEKQQQETAVKYEEDPIEYIRQENDQLKQRLQHYDNRFSQQDQQAEVYQKQQQFVSNYQQAAQEYSKQAADFQDAYQFLVQSRLNELQAAGYDQATASQLFVQEEAMVVGKAFEDGVNPAERVHALAKARGFAPKAEEKTQEEVKMETLKKGAEAAKSLPSGGGKSEITLEALADLEDDEFDKVWEKLVG